MGLKVTSRKCGNCIGWVQDHSMDNYPPKGKCKMQVALTNFGDVTPDWFGCIYHAYMASPPEEGQTDGQGS